MNEDNIKEILSYFLKAMISGMIESQVENMLQELCKNIKAEYGIEAEFKVAFIVTKIGDKFLNKTKDNNSSPEDVLPEILEILNKKK